MFTYGLLKGIQLGLLDETTFLEPAKKAYEMMVEKFVVEEADGTLNWEGTVSVGSLNSDASYEVRSSRTIVSHLLFTNINAVLHYSCYSRERPQRNWPLHVGNLRI